MGEVFADRLQVTIERMAYRDVRSLLLPILQTLGAYPDMDDPATERGLWRHVDGGTLKVSRYGKVAAIGASGRFLSALRAARMLGEFLHTLGTQPHKVSVLDATLDVAADAPPIVAAFYDRATGLEGIQLTRKRVPATEVTKVFGQRPDGRESGTVYAGSRHAETQLKVYDKQNERFFHGIMDAAPGVRYELTLKSGQATLSDVYDPTCIFWHHMHRILDKPAHVIPWVRNELGNTLPVSLVLTPLERLRRRVELSPDMAELVRLSRECSTSRVQIGCLSRGEARDAAHKLLETTIAWAYP